MKTGLKLSVITITYNDVEGFRRTVESVESQTWRGFEWIVIDGGSSDGTKVYLESLNPQPDYWVSEPDRGVYDAMNKGIAQAKGEYLLFMNGGDSFCNERVLEEVFNGFPDGDIVYGDAIYHFRDGVKKVCHPDVFNLYHLWITYATCHQPAFVRQSNQGRRWVLYKI